jgi:hypothetical protein
MIICTAFDVNCPRLKTMANTYDYCAPGNGDGMAAIQMVGVLNYLDPKEAIGAKGRTLK